MITILVLGASGQETKPKVNSVPDTVAETKVSKDQEKKAAKAEKKRQENLLRDRTVNLAAVKTFPNNFAGKDLRIRGLRLVDVKPYKDGDNTMYFVATEEYPGNESTFGFPLPDTVAFVVSESAAQEIVKRSGYRNYGIMGSGDVRPLADVWFRLIAWTSNGRTYYLAKVDCLVFSGLKSSSVGGCSV